MPIQMKKNGFTLIELMMVVAIAGILASIAYPSYQNSIIKSRRKDATGALMGFANAMERHFTATNSYLGAAGTQLVPADTGAPWIFPSQSPVEGTAKYYDLTISAATATTYTLRATPIGGQAVDGALEVTNTGIRKWDKNHDADFDDPGENSWEDHG